MYLLIVAILGTVLLLIVNYLAIKAIIGSYKNEFYIQMFFGIGLFISGLTPLTILWAAVIISHCL